MKLRLRFGYAGKLTRNGGKLFHDITCSELDKFGETTQQPLRECLIMLLDKLREDHVVGWILVV
jgi:hypothetical protein